MKTAPLLLACLLTQAAHAGLFASANTVAARPITDPRGGTWGYRMLTTPDQAGIPANKLVSADKSTSTATLTKGSLDTNIVTETYLFKFQDTPILGKSTETGKQTFQIKRVLTQITAITLIKPEEKSYAKSLFDTLTNTLTKAYGTPRAPETRTQKATFGWYITPRIRKRHQHRMVLEPQHHQHCQHQHGMAEHRTGENTHRQHLLTTTYTAISAHSHPRKNPADQTRAAAKDN